MNVCSLARQPLLSMNRECEYQFTWTSGKSALAILVNQNEYLQAIIGKTNTTTAIWIARQAARVEGTSITGFELF